MTLTMTRKYYSVSRSAIDENNDGARKSWIVFHNRIVVKFTYAAKFSAAKDLPLNYTVGDLVIKGSPHTRRDPATAIVFALKSSAVYSCLYVFDEKNHYSIE